MSKLSKRCERMSEDKTFYSVCGSSCEANAYQIAVKQLNAKIEELEHYESLALQLSAKNCELQDRISDHTISLIRREELAKKQDRIDVLEEKLTKIGYILDNADMLSESEFISSVFEAMVIK